MRQLGRLMLCAVLAGGAYFAYSVLPRNSFVEDISGGYQKRRAEHSLVAFRDVNVVPMTSDQVLGRQTVVVENGRIISIGDVKTTAIPSGALLVEGDGCYLLDSGRGYRSLRRPYP